MNFFWTYSLISVIVWHLSLVTVYHFPKRRTMILSKKSSRLLVYRTVSQNKIWRHVPHFLFFIFFFHRIQQAFSYVQLQAYKSAAYYCMYIYFFLILKPVLSLFERCWSLRLLCSMQVTFWRLHQKKKEKANRLNVKRKAVFVFSISWLYQIFSPSIKLENEIIFQCNNNRS